MAIKPAYFAKEAASNVRRNMLMAIASILAVAISLVLVGSVFMLSKVVSNITRHWENDVVINVFLLPDATDAQIASAQSTILEYKEVKDVKFVSKKDAYEEFQEMFQHEKELVENVDADTLPASFRISLHDPETLETVSERMEKIEGVDEVLSAKDEVQKVQTVLRILSLIVFFVAAILLAAAVVLISNTIRLAIFARRKEIGIMKLVGATNWFIRWPFMLEGLLQGLAGAVIAIGLMWLIREFIFNWVNSRLAFLPLGISNTYMLMTYGLVALVGAAIAVGGTFAALRKHLEV